MKAKERLTREMEIAVEKLDPHEALAMIDFLEDTVLDDGCSDNILLSKRQLSTLLVFSRIGLFATAIFAAESRR